MIERIRTLERIASRLDPGPEERAALARAVLDYAEGFLARLATDPAYGTADDAGAALLAAPIEGEPIGIEAALALLDRGVDRLGAAPAPGHLAFIPGSSLYHAALGDFLAAVSNRYSGHFYGSPGAVRMENTLLRWMAALVGYPDGAAGNLTSGGSMASLVAVVTAREAAGIKGRDLHRVVVYLTDQVHHSVPKALRVAGLGECIQRPVPTDERCRMSPDALAAAIGADRAAGLNPWLVVASAGTTNTGAVDPLPAIGDIAARHGLWLHLDAAYGGFFALAPAGKPILGGMETSHSIILDPHKGLFLPFGTGAVLTKDAASLRAAHRLEGDYMQDADRPLPELSPSELSPELSRHFRGLRLWLPLKLLGTEPFAAALEEKLLLARVFHERIQELDGVVVGPPPDLSIATFRIVPPRGDADEFNRRLVAAVQDDGRLFLSSTRLGGRFMIRLAILGFRTHLETIEHALAVIRDQARRLAAT